MSLHLQLVGPTIWLMFCYVRVRDNYDLFNVCINAHILNGHDNIDPNIFSNIRRGKITSGHYFTCKGRVGCMLESVIFPRRLYGPIMYGWNILPAACMHCNSINMFTYEQIRQLSRKGRFTCRLSISQRLLCLQPSELLLGWQSLNHARFRQVMLPSRSAITWGRVVALFSVAAGLAEDCVKQG